MTAAARAGERLAAMRAQDLRRAAEEGERAPRSSEPGTRRTGRSPGPSCKTFTGLTGGPGPRQPTSGGCTGRPPHGRESMGRLHERRSGS